MIVVEKTEGKKISHGQMGENLLILDDALYINLAVYERDFPVSIDISRNEFGMLTMGLSRSYVAQIDIPKREYDDAIGDEDGEGDAQPVKVPIPFDMSKVTLTLWGEEL